METIFLKKYKTEFGDNPLDCGKITSLGPIVSQIISKPVEPDDLVVNNSYHSYSYADGSSEGPTIVFMKNLTKKHTPLRVNLRDDEDWSVCFTPNAEDVFLTRVREKFSSLKFSLKYLYNYKNSKLGSCIV